MNKVALSFIMKGDEDPAQIARMLTSIASHVDAMYGVSTWIEDSPAIKLCKSFGVHMSFHKWQKDFSEARNWALDQIPEEYNWITWMDTDDVIEGASNIKKIIEEPYDCVYCLYNYDIDKEGRVLQYHPRERIVRRSLYRWGAQGLPVGALHENLTPIKQARSIFVKEIIWNHYPEKSDPILKTKRNIEILESVYKKEGDNHDPRTEFYLARAYFDTGEYVKAESLFYDYLEKSGWDEERATAKNLLGEIYRLNEKFDEAIECYYSAIKERDDVPAFWVNLGMAYADKEYWDKALHFTEVALQMPQPKSAMVLMPFADEVRALSTMYRAYMAKRKIKEAHAVSRKLAKITGDKWAIKQEKFAWDILRWTEMSKSVGMIIDELNSLDEKDKISSLVNSLPSTIEDNGFIENLKKKYIKAKIWPEKSIVYFLGQGVESFWDENSTAIGGSETAVINLTRQWAKDGYDVTVYGSPKEDHTDKNGVHWVQWYKFNPQDTFDIIINWRNPNLDKIKARKKIVDFHDVPSYIYFSKELVDSVDHFLVKSEYQKSLIDNKEAQDKCIVISNGYTPYSVKENHDNKKIIYASSYDRGLEYLLKWGWPIIKEKHPEAELHIYYGWNVFDAINRDNYERRAWKDKMIKLMQQKGIYEHGRIDQKQLLQEKAHAKIHFYPTTFEEIDCITIRESAAVGCVPLTSDYAVFKEKEYVEKIEGNPRDKKTQEKLAEKACELLGSELSNQREEFKRLAQKEQWETIAKQWEKLVF